MQTTAPDEPGAGQLHRRPKRGGREKLLDIGCGGGLLAETMAQRGAQVTAIDLSEEALQVAPAARSGISTEH